MVRRVVGWRVRELDACKVLDFLADDGDAAFVGGVEFEDTRAEELRSEEGFGEGEDCGGFTGAGGTVEEHVWEL